MDGRFKSNLPALTCYVIGNVANPESGEDCPKCVFEEPTKKPTKKDKWTQNTAHDDIDDTSCQRFSARIGVNGGKIREGQLI